LREVYTLLRLYYVNPKAITSELLEKGSVDEMLATLNDPYTRHISASDWQQTQSYLEGNSFIGIGVKLSADGGIMVLGVVPGSPADESGIRPGDLVLAIDDESTSEMTAEQAAHLSHGLLLSGDTLLLPWSRSKPQVSIKLCLQCVPLLLTIHTKGCPAT
jgi:carboxyl-terminal processing protease